MASVNTNLVLVVIFVFGIVFVTFMVHSNSNKIIITRAVAEVKIIGMESNDHMYASANNTDESKRYLKDLFLQFVNDFRRLWKHKNVNGTLTWPTLQDNATKFLPGNQTKIISPNEFLPTIQKTLTNQNVSKPTIQSDASHQKIATSTIQKKTSNEKIATPTIKNKSSNQNTSKISTPTIQNKTSNQTVSTPTIQKKTANQTISTPTVQNKISNQKNNTSTIQNQTTNEYAVILRSVDSVQRRNQNQTVPISYRLSEGCSVLVILLVMPFLAILFAIMMAFAYYGYIPLTNTRIIL